MPLNANNQDLKQLNKPFYIFRPKKLKKNVETFIRKFDGETIYSVKTNPNDYVIENADSEDYWPFVLEKYIKIHEKDEPPTEVAGRADNLYNIVNIEDWDSFIKDLKNSSSEPDKLISDLWIVTRCTDKPTNGLI